MTSKQILKIAEKRAQESIQNLKASGQLERALNEFGKDAEWQLKAMFKSQIVEYLTRKQN